MFDGRDYNQSFNRACSNLARETDEELVRETLCEIEWVLAEAIRGALLYTAMLQAVLVAFPIAWALGIRDMDWTAQTLFAALLIGYAAVNYWLSRFVFWHEISRHIGSRRFGY